MVEKKIMWHVPGEYVDRVRAGNTKEASDKRQLLRVDDYLEFTGTDYKKHDYEDIEAYIQHGIARRDNGRRYVQQQFFFIRKFYEWLVPKTIDENPADHVDTEHYFGKGQPASKKDEKANGHAIYYFEPEEVDELITHAPDPVARNRFLIKLMFLTGPRAKEVVELKWDDDIDEDHRIITYTTAKSRGKTETRDVPYAPSLDRYLRNWRRKQQSRLGGTEADHVFTGRRRDDNGNLCAISPERVNAVVRKAAESAGLQETIYTDANGRERKKYSSHALRHSYAVYYVQGGDGKGTSGDIKSLKDLLGHSSTEITERYLNFKPSTLNDLARRHGPS
jgi:integrase/recombinase XerD